MLAFECYVDFGESIGEVSLDVDITDGIVSRFAVRIGGCARYEPDDVFVVFEFSELGYYLFRHIGFAL
jgi:hypothetical protein